MSRGALEWVTSTWRGLLASPRWLAALAVLAAGVLAVQANVLVARYYARWDLTSEGTYTLSQPTRDLLGSLEEPLEITVLLSRSDRLLVDVRHMLDAYRAIAPDLRIEYVDPDAEPARFLSLQQRHGIAAGATQDGRLITDASLIIGRDDRFWFVSADELVSFDDEGFAQPRIEAALTEGIARVVAHERDRICFTSGHGELSLEDGSSQGLGELRHRLERSNFDVDTVDLAGPAGRARHGGRHFTGCHLVVVAGPERTVPPGAARLLEEHVASGGNLLLLLNPVVDDDGRLRPSGLEGAARLAGIDIEAAFVIDPDPASRLPQGIGETFFARPKVHGITRGLALSEERVEARPLLIAAQPLGTTPESVALPLLQSSSEAFAVDDLRPLQASGGRAAPRGERPGPLALAYAAELPAPSGPAPRGARLVVVGAANVAWSRNWRDPALFGTRLFMENTIAWLADRPALVSVPERPRHPAGLSVTEESLLEIQRYVLIYMPLTAALSGLFILLRRRRTERLSRREEAA